MDRKMLAAIAFVTLLVGCATGAAVSEIIIPRAKAASTQKWEYFCTAIPRSGMTGIPEYREVTKLLNKAGVRGWELTGPLQAGGYSHGACFKRPAGS